MAMMTGATGDFFGTLTSSKVYKAGQGTKARNGTIFGLLALIGYGMYAWSSYYAQSAPAIRWGVPIIIGAICAWIVYRAVHYPRFADFLISTEAEVNKVSWPGKRETRAYTIVVIVNVILMSVFLFCTDWIWKYLLSWLGILKIGHFMGGSENMFNIPPIPWVMEAVRSIWS